MRQSVLFSLIGVLVVIGAGFFITLNKTQTPKECPPVQITIDASNSVHGLKDGKLFGYIDLAADVPALACHTDADIDPPLKEAVLATVEKWWQEPRLQQADKAEIHIISILDKDEYAKASFNSALVHGKLEFTRSGDNVTAQPESLSFDNMRKKMGMDE